MTTLIIVLILIIIDTAATTYIICYFLNNNIKKNKMNHRAQNAAWRGAMTNKQAITILINAAAENDLGTRNEDELPDLYDALELAIDALEATRWRDPNVEPPTGDEEYPVWAVMNDSEPELMWYVPEAGCACFWRREYEAGEVVSTETVWYRSITAYMKLPKWERKE